MFKKVVSASSQGSKQEWKTVFRKGFPFRMGVRSLQNGTLPENISCFSLSVNEQLTVLVIQSSYLERIATFFLVWKLCMNV